MADELASFVKLKKRIEKLQDDMLGHGLWERRNGKWRVLRRRKTRTGPERRVKGLTRAVLPQPEIVDRKILTQINLDMVRTAKELEAVCERLHTALSPLRYERPQYSRQRPQ